MVSCFTLHLYGFPEVRRVKSGWALLVKGEGEEKKVLIDIGPARRVRCLFWGFLFARLFLFSFVG